MWYGSRFSGAIFIFSVISLVSLASERVHSQGNGLTHESSSPLSSTVDSPSFFKTVIDTNKPENKLKGTSEIISQTVGVDVNNLGGLGRFSTVSIRGSQPNQVVITIDGIKLGTPSNQIIDLSSIPIAMADSIEIIRGGASAEYGDGAIGGVINIIPSTKDSPSHNSASLHVGSFGTSSISLGLNDGGKRLNYLLSSSFGRSEGNFGFKNDNGTPNNPDDDYSDVRENNRQTTFGVFSRGGYENGKNVRASLSNEFYFSSRGVPGTVSFPSLHANEENLRNNTAIKLNLKEALHKTDLQITLHAGIDSLNFKDPEGELTGVPLSTKQRGFSSGFEVLSDSVPARRHLLSLKIGLEHSGLNQTVQDSTNIEPYRISPNFSFKYEIPFGKFVELIPSLRFDFIFDRGPSLSSNDFVPSPKIGVLVSPLKGLSFKSNVGSSFRYPNFDELYFSEGFVEGNSDLKRERAINFDIGMRYSKPTFSAEISYFLNRVTDIIVYEQVSNFRYRPINIGRALIQGVEISSSLLPLSFLKITVNNTFLRAINKSVDPSVSGNDIPGKPQSRSNIRLSFVNKGGEIYGEFQAVSSNYVNQANTVELSPRYIINAGISYDLDENVSIRGEAKNLLNRQIEDVRGFPLPGISFIAGVNVKL